MPNETSPSPELIDSSATTEGHNDTTIKDTTEEHPSAFQKLMQNILTASNPLPHWHKTKMKVTFRDNKGVVHRGILVQKFDNRYSINIRQSKHLKPL